MQSSMASNPLSILRPSMAISCERNENISSYVPRESSAERRSPQLQPALLLPSKLTFSRIRVLCLFLHTAPYPAEAYDDDPDAERAEWRGDLLRELAETGMDFVRGLRRRVMAAEPRVAEPEPAVPPSPADPAANAPAADFSDVALTFSRLSRAVRLTLSLDERLERRRRMPAAAGVSAAKGASAPTPPAFDPDDPETWITPPANLDEIRAGGYRKVVRAMVKVAIENEADPYEAPRLMVELEKRLFDPARDEAFARDGIGELINAIRLDLGLPHDPNAWNGAAELGIRPGSLARMSREGQAERALAEAMLARAPPSFTARAQPPPAQAVGPGRWSCGPPAT